MAQNQLPTNGTSDAAGNLTLIFPAVGTNAEFSGLVSIPTAPATAETFVVVNDQIVTRLGGSSQYGTIQLGPQDVLMLVSSGLKPLTQYQGICTGVVVSGTIGPQIPTPTASAVEAALIGALAPVPDEKISAQSFTPAGQTLVAAVPGFRVVLGTIQVAYESSTGGSVETAYLLGTINGSLETIPGSVLTVAVTGTGIVEQILIYPSISNQFPRGLIFDANTDITVHGAPGAIQTYFFGATYRLVPV